MSSKGKLSSLSHFLTSNTLLVLSVGVSFQVTLPAPSTSGQLVSSPVATIHEEPNSTLPPYLRTQEAPYLGILHRYLSKIGAVCGDTHSVLVMAGHQSELTNTNPLPGAGGGNIPPITPNQLGTPKVRIWRMVTRPALHPMMRTLTMTVTK
ncbi:hypothetical protein PIB30_071980 [Stylosanthes scabra]|uniref:Uncharacterized protein n=1 Tax=Stylosanthes scabra TaxID=79078 RepID=A0ABU6UR74_9FABA|nr:hypothetical protein [Stylosanthes scabra]